MSQFTNDRVWGFLHTEGTRICNEAGEEVILRGYGAGNWTNPEGFMVGASAGFGGGGSLGADRLELPGRFERARSMDSTVRELCGTAYAKTFWPRWYRNHLGEADIRAMAELGFNSVRLPLCAWAFLPEEPEISWNEDSFQMLTDILDWCETYRVYAILDMHAAPGGQSALPCDDGIDNKPHMFTEPESRERTMLLWEELARRYGDRWIVAGYDLLNEPISVPNSWYLMPELANFYEELIARLRKIDQKHIFFLEGATFSTNVEIFDRDYDPEFHNWVLTTHLYGFSPEVKDLYKFLLVSRRWNVPIWIGEGGSGLQDMTVFYELAAQYSISINLWVWKAAGNPQTGRSMGICSYPLPAGWEVMQDYFTKGGPRPSYARAQAMMDEYLENLKFEHCIIDTEKPRYVLRHNGITVPGAGYDGTPGSFSGNWMLGNFLNYRLEDRTKLVLRPGAKVPSAHPAFGMQGPSASPLDQLWLELSEGEFAHYTIRDTECPTQVTVQIRGVTEATVVVRWNMIGGTLRIPAGEEAVSYPAIAIPPAEASAVRVEVRSGTVQIAGVSFSEYV